MVSLKQSHVWWYSLAFRMSSRGLLTYYSGSNCNKCDWILPSHQVSLCPVLLLGLADLATPSLPTWYNIFDFISSIKHKGITRIKAPGLSLFIYGEVSSQYMSSRMDRLKPSANQMGHISLNLNNRKQPVQAAHPERCYDTNQLVFLLRKPMLKWNCFQVGLFYD